MSSSATLLRSLSQCFTSASIKQPLRCIHRRFSQLRCSSAPRHQRTLAAIYRLESTVASMPEYEQENRIIRSNLPDMEIPEVPLAHYLLKCFDDYKDLKAMVNFSTGQEYTYSQMKESVIKVASALTRLGYKKGDIIGMICVNCPEYAIFVMGCSAVGIIVSPANPMYTPGELARHITHSESVSIVTMPALLDTVLTARADNPNIKLKDIFIFGEGEGCRPFSTLLADDGKAFPENVDFDVKKDIAVMPYSSGTTGLPKGVMLTHHNIVSNLFQLKEIVPLQAGVDRLLGLLPFFHIYGFTCIMFGGLQSGSKIVTLPRFDPQDLVNVVNQHKITVLHVVPPIVLFLVKHPMCNDLDVTEMNMVINGAAPLGADLSKQLVDKFNVSLAQGFGLTETSPVVHFDVPPPKLGSIGRPVQNTLAKVIDLETKKCLGPNEDGEICVQGPQIMAGYLRDPESTANTIINGWLHTGDIGHYDEEGYFFVSDRLKELIKYKGYQVAPAELEALIVTHPHVADVAVIGVPDEEAGELPMAFVVSAPDAKQNADEILELVQKNLAPYKKLRGGVKFVDEIPKAASGKILRRVLRDSLKNTA